MPTLSDQQKFKAARVILGWTQKDLAARAEIGQNTVVAFELGTRAMMPKNKQACWEVFHNAGILFTDYAVGFIPTPKENTTND